MGVFAQLSCYQGALGKGSREQVFLPAGDWGILWCLLLDLGFINITNCYMYNGHQLCCQLTVIGFKSYELVADKDQNFLLHNLLHINTPFLCQVLNMFVKGVH